MGSEIRYRVVFMVTLIVFLSSAVIEAQEAHPYFPLGDEYRWEFDFQYRLHRQIQVMDGSTVTRVEGVREIKGIEYYNVVTITSGIPGAKPSRSFIRVGEKGVYAISGDDIGFGEYLAMPTQVDLGTTWTVKGPKGKQTCKVVGTEDVYLENKTFENCIQVECKGKVKGQKGKLRSAVETQRCAGVGTVKEIGSMKEAGIELARGSMMWDSTLESYKFGEGSSN